MKILNQFLVGLITLFFLAATSCKKTNITPVAENKLISAETTTATPLISKAGPSANGQGGLTINNRVQHFAFQASTDKDGIVSGSWESKSPGQDVRTHGTINCLVLLDNNTAVLSGFITQLSGYAFGYQVGDPVWFMVKDNGEGANNPPDEFTDYYLGLGGCFNYGFPLQTIEKGNIQVKP